MARLMVRQPGGDNIADSIDQEATHRRNGFQAWTDHHSDEDAGVVSPAEICSRDQRAAGQPRSVAAAI